MPSHGNPAVDGGNLEETKFYLRGINNSRKKNFKATLYRSLRSLLLNSLAVKDLFKGVRKFRLSPISLLHLKLLT